MSLKIENLSKSYDQNHVLKNVSLNAAEGEILGIFGVTGAGKSTLIRIVSGADNCDGGTIIHKDNDVTMLSCDDRNFHFPRLTNESFWNKIFKTEKNSILPDGEGQVSRFGIEHFVAQGAILLHVAQTYRGIEVRKMRGTRHDTNVHRMRITDKGLVVSPGEHPF